MPVTKIYLKNTYKISATESLHFSPSANKERFYFQDCFSCLSWLSCFYVFYSLLCFCASLAVWSDLAGCLKCFDIRSMIFIAVTALLCLYILLSWFLFLCLSVFQYFTPYCVCLTPSSEDSFSCLLHSPLFSFALFLPLCPSLWPTKVISHHVFPIMLSSHPAVRRWTPGRRYKGHDLQGPFATKKGKRKKKTLNERSVFQHSSLVLQCRFHSSKFWLEIWRSGHDMVWSNFVRLQKCQNLLPQEKKTVIKPGLVFPMCVLLTCLNGVTGRSKWGWKWEQQLKLF